MSKHPVAKRPPMSLGGSSLSPPYYTAWAYGPQPPLGIKVSALQHGSRDKARAHEAWRVISHPPHKLAPGANLDQPHQPRGANLGRHPAVEHPPSPASLGGSFLCPPLLYCMGIRPPATPGDQSVCVTTWVT